MADRLVIEGGQRLIGQVPISAAKNAALPIMTASLLTPEPLVIENLPGLVDVATIGRVLEGLGTHLRVNPDGSTVLTTAEITGHLAPYELVSTMRASVLVLGPLLARGGRARVALPGGCAIGLRPIDQHLKGLELLGASITLTGGYVETKATRLRGTRIVCDISTVTGTENLMMAAALAEGTTVIENAAMEPEVVDLARCLTSMGAEIEGAGSPRIRIHGVEALRGARHRVIPDRIEAGTFMVAAAITAGDVTLCGVSTNSLAAVAAKLQEAGATVTASGDQIRVVGPRHPEPVDVETAPFPGFPTDMQAQFMALLGLARGTSVITETVFENRFLHAAELRRLGAVIEIDGNRAVVRGVPHYTGAPVMATDLRASASLILAGLAAEGTTEISRVYHLDRGYERIEAKFSSLGAAIRRVR